MTESHQIINKFIIYLFRYFNNNASLKDINKVVGGLGFNNEMKLKNLKDTYLFGKKFYKHSIDDWVNMVKVSWSEWDMVSFYGLMALIRSKSYKQRWKYCYRLLSDYRNITKNDD